MSEYRKVRVKSPEAGQWEKRWPVHGAEVRHAPEKAASKRAPEAKAE